MKGAPSLGICHNGRLGAERPDERSSVEGLGSGCWYEDLFLVRGGLKTWLESCKMGAGKEVMRENYYPVRHPVGQPFYPPDM
jgi:hypothetical protein